MGKFKEKIHQAKVLSMFLRKRDITEEWEEIKVEGKKQNKHPIQLPWQKSDRDELKEKKAAIERNPDAFKGGKLMRIKFAEKHQPTKVGVGYPSRGLVYANLGIARGTEQREVMKRTKSGRPLIYRPLKTKIPQPIPDKIFHEYCTRMGIGVFEEGEQEKEEEASSSLDLDAFDLYWEDIRIEKDTLLRELRHMPLKDKIELENLGLFERSMYHLSRSCFYSPSYTHKQCEDIIHIYVWLLNRNNMPLVFHVKVLQCLSVIVYSSPFFKKELANCGGIQVIVRIMQLGMVYCGLQASWAAYCLTMAAIGSPDVIKELKKIKDIDERIGEITFHMFWYHWPTNFGMILQSLMYGPGGVANSLDMFEFL